MSVHRRGKSSPLWNKLPSELGGVIYSFLLPLDFFRSGVLVCSSWRQMVCRWTSFTITTDAEQKALRFARRRGNPSPTNLILARHWPDLEYSKLEQAQFYFWNGEFTLPQVKQLSIINDLDPRFSWWVDIRPCMLWIGGSLQLHTLELPPECSFQVLIPVAMTLPALKTLRLTHRRHFHCIFDSLGIADCNNCISVSHFSALLQRLDVFDAPGLVSSVGFLLELHCPNLVFLGMDTTEEPEQMVCDFQKRHPRTQLVQGCDDSECCSYLPPDMKLWQ